jgi:hypothetical protein
MLMLNDRSLLHAALLGYEHKLAELRRAVDAIHRKLGNPAGVPGLLPSLAAPRKKRRMSAAARKRIAAAQKKRWAEFHKTQKA